MHLMKVNEIYYNLLKSGNKTIELRLYDEKRKNIKTGDIIEFSNTSDVNDKFMAKVTNIYHADNFIELCKNIDCTKAGFSTDSELINVLESFYSSGLQKVYGVVGIEIQIHYTNDTLD